MVYVILDHDMDTILKFVETHLRNHFQTKYPYMNDCFWLIQLINTFLNNKDNVV